MTTAFSGWHHQYVETNHVRLHYVTQGEGELVILLHSVLEFWYSWRFQIPALSRQFRVVVPDLRGCNDSEKPATGYDLDTLSQDILGLMTSLGYSRAHIIGHAWGGTLAWHLAQTMPESVSRLAILNGAHPQQFRRLLVSNLDQLRRSWRLLALQLPALPEWMIEQNLPGFVRSFFQNQAVRKGAFSAQNAELYQAALGKPGAIAAALNYYRQLLSLPTWMKGWGAPIEPIDIPTLVLWGEEDTFFSQALLDNLATLVTAPLQLRQIPQCGHWIQQEAPQVVNRELLKFLCEA
ncbi:MAG: alpha/beta hydrolase [Cyanobacteria bacterium Co-bin8]|nr:alpha/beta hydrolase [Cyanobacteria bacterium Co-bin8]